MKEEFQKRKFLAGDKEILIGADVRKENRHVTTGAEREEIFQDVFLANTMPFGDPEKSQGL